MHLAEAAAEHLGHRGRHVLHAAAGEHGHVVGRGPRDHAGPLVERVEAAGQARDHDPGARGERVVEPVVGDPRGVAEQLGVEVERGLGGEGVLVHADANGIRRPGTT